MQAPVATMFALGALLLGGCAAAPGPMATRIDVSFEGTDRIAFRLRRVIEDLLIDFEQDPSSEVPLFDAALDLQDWFVDQGYPDANVTYRLQRDGRPRVVFAIASGPEVTVRRVEFHGNDSIRGAELRTLWSRTNSGQLGLGDPLFVLADLEALKLSVLQFYDERGWLDIAVDGPNVTRPAGADRVEVDYTVVEGERYAFGALEIAAELPLTPKQIGGDGIAGKPFARSTATAIALHARNELLHSGYPDPRVDLEVVPDKDAHTVMLRLRGEPGPRAEIATVGITGNARTAEFVIARHLRMQPGQLYNGQAIEQTTSALYRTGLFRRVEVERQPHDGRDDRLDLLVRVDEADARDLDLLAGYGSYETVRGGVFWTDRNLFGLGQRLQLGARASIRGESLTTSWSEPHFFGSDTSLTVAGHATERQEPSFTDTSRGLDAAFARDLVGPLRGRIGYSLQSRDGRDVDPTLTTAADSRYEIGSVFTELSIDRRDSPLYPNRGHRLSLKYEHAGQGVGGNVDLDRLTWSSSYFLTLAPDVVVGASWRTGSEWPHGTDLPPLQERFFNGGESSVRSFRESQLGPQSVNGTPLGGAWFNTANLELRFPIVATLHGAVFADVGNVGSDVHMFGLSNLHWGLGGGLRFVLPIGPVRLDVAGNPSPEPGDDRWVLHFSVGLPF